jgi:chromosome segregation ATPase
MTDAHQDVAGVVERLRGDPNGNYSIVREESATLIESLSKALSEAEAERDVLNEVNAELLAAIPLEKATLQDLQDSSEAYRKDCEAAESRLAEAVKVIEPFAAMPGCYEMHEDDVIYKNAGAALTAGDFRAARRFINAGKE